MMATIEGVDKVYAEMDRIYNTALSSAWKEKAVRKLLAFAENEIKRRMATTPRDPKNTSGLSRKRVKLGVGRSYPGNPPAVDTGNLRRSIRHWAVMMVNDAVGYIGSSAEYALYLEEGTLKMEARPVWFDTIKAMIDKHAQRLHLEQLDVAYKADGG